MTIELSVLNISDSNRHVLQTVCMLIFDYTLEGTIRMITLWFSNAVCVGLLVDSKGSRLLFDN